MATHPGGRFAPEITNKYIRCGSSPRGAQALLLAAKVKALCEGRFHASTADIKSVAAPCLRHRVLLNFEAEADRIDADAIVEKVLASTPTEPISV
jgi:MoxR-like ATPase